MKLMGFPGVVVGRAFGQGKPEYVICPAFGSHTLKLTMNSQGLQMVLRSEREGYQWAIRKRKRHCCRRSDGGRGDPLLRNALAHGLFQDDVWASITHRGLRVILP